MFTNVNLAAPVGALALLGAGFLLLLAILLFVYGLFTRRFGFARLVVVVTLIAGAIYFGAVLAFSFASKDQVLARGQEKHFCELDCHLAYSILDVRQTKTLGNAPDQTSANGMFYVVTVRTRFDPETISSSRGNASLTPNSRLVNITDSAGNSYAPSYSGEQALARTEGPGTALTTALRPGESYVTKIVFDLPSGSHNLTLLMREGEWVTHFVIGHENSPWHKKTRFQLGV